MHHLLFEWRLLKIAVTSCFMKLLNKIKTIYLWDVVKDFLFRICSSALGFLIDRCQPITVSIPLKRPPSANLWVTSCESVDVVFYSLRLRICWLKPTTSWIPWTSTLALCVWPWPLTSCDTDQEKQEEVSSETTYYIPLTVHWLSSFTAHAGTQLKYFFHKWHSPSIKGKKTLQAHLLHPSHCSNTKAASSWHQAASGMMWHSAGRLMMIRRTENHPPLEKTRRAVKHEISILGKFRWTTFPF